MYRLTLLALSLSAPAQAATTLTSAGGKYTLKMDYLSVLSGSAKLAYKASLTSIDLQTFTVDLSSVAAVTADSTADPAITPQLVIAGGKISLELPNLSVGGKSYAVSLSTADMSRFAVDGSSLKTLSTSAATAVTASNVNSQTVGSYNMASSTQVKVSWTAPTGVAVSSYVITAREVDGVSSVSATAAATDTSATLQTLKASTKYLVNVTACLDSSCANQATAAAVSFTTSSEYWQLQGSGTGYSGVTKVVSDGSSLSWVMRWGSQAGTTNSGRYQYYYKANAVGRTGIGIASTSKSDISVATLTSFTANTSAGLRNPCTSPDAPYTDCPASGGYFINAIQAVPLAKDGKIRVYFEAIDAREANQPTRIYSLDSQDGLLGVDFNSSTSLAYCGGNGSTDYATGGTCTPKVEIGVTSDTGSTKAPFTAARQFKIGWDWLSDWRWDGASGTFMIITGDDACAKNLNSLFYATWDGSKWTAVTDSSGCAKPLVAKAHGPVVVPLGGSRYKVYYEDETNGTQNGKPLRFIYADGNLTAGAGTIEMDDWEASSKARDVNFLWPDGSLLDAQDEAGLGDHMVLTPAGTLEQQFMFVNLGGFDNSKWKAASSGLGLAVLLNP